MKRIIYSALVAMFVLTGVAHNAMARPWGGSPEGFGGIEQPFNGGPWYGRGYQRSWGPNINVGGPGSSPWSLGGPPVVWWRGPYRHFLAPYIGDRAPTSPLPPEVQRHGYNYAVPGAEGPGTEPEEDEGWMEPLPWEY